MIRMPSPLVFTLLLCLALFACSPAEKTSAPVRLGINVWPGYEYLFLAREKGFFADEGLNLKLVETGSLYDLRRAFERGKVDGMAASVIEVVQAAANSGRIAKIFMVPDFSNGADVIVARTPIQSVAELKGKRIGMELASLGQFMVARALQMNDLSLDDITVVPMSQEGMVRAVQDNQVDAVMAYPPVSVELLRRADMGVIFSSGDIPGEVMDVVALTPEILRQQPEVPQKILRVWQRALDFAAANPEEAHSIAANREGISAKEFAAALEGIKLLSIAEQRELLGDKIAIERILSAIMKVAVVESKRANLPPEGEFIYTEALMSL